MGENLDIDAINEETLVEVPKATKAKAKATKTVEKTEPKDMDSLVNCLRNEKIIVRHIPKQTGNITNPKHVLYGGMSENAVKIFVVPKLSSGHFVNVLTDNEKEYLEEIMGLEYNALSVYKRENNFWDDANDIGISKVALRKQDNYFDLSKPEDYIKYKILLANKNFIAASPQELEDRPKATYQFVIMSANDEIDSAKNKLTIAQRCYKELGKIEDDIETLRVVLELIDGRPTSKNVKLEFLQGKIYDVIQSNGKLFLRVVSDPLLSTKVLIKKCVENGLISNRDNHYYLRSDNSPLCENGEESTLNIAAKFLASPKRQELKFSLEAKLKA